MVGGIAAIACAICVFILSPISAETEKSALYRTGPVAGRMVDAGFLKGETNYHAVELASDGCVYYGIGSHAPGASATLFRYDPRTGKVRTLASMNDVTGEDGSKVFNQGKIHCDLYEMKGRLYFSTQGGYYQGGNLGPFPGGHFLSYDMKTGTCADLGIGAPGEGMVTMSVDTVRGRMYAITWPGMHFIYHDISSGKTKDFGKAVATPGIEDLTAVPGNRSIGVDPRDGAVYWHNMDETISRYDYTTDTVTVLSRPTLDIPVLKTVRAGFDKVLWRAIRWSPSMSRFYAVDTGMEYLFSYEPMSGEIEIIDRIAAGPHRRSGAAGGASLAFELDAEGKVVYYVTPARSTTPGGESRRELRLVTYDIVSRRYIDHGPIRLDDGRYPNGCSGLDVGRDGNLYLVCMIPLPNIDGAREKKIVAAHFPEIPREKLKDTAYEMNLVVLKNPLLAKGK